MNIVLFYARPQGDEFERGDLGARSIELVTEDLYERGKVVEAIDRLPRLSGLRPYFVVQANPDGYTEYEPCMFNHVQQRPYSQEAENALDQLLSFGADRPLCSILFVIDFDLLTRDLVENTVSPNEMKDMVLRQCVLYPETEVRPNEYHVDWGPNRLFHLAPQREAGVR